MLKTLLTNNITSNNFTRKQKDLLSGCSEANYMTSYDPVDFEYLQLKASDFFCINNTVDKYGSKHFWGAFGEGLIFEGLDASGKYFEPVLDAFASTLSLIKVTATVDTNVELFTYIYTFTEPNVVQDYVLVFKENWQGRIKSKNKDNINYLTEIAIPNSQNSIVTITPEDDATAYYLSLQHDGELGFSGTNREVTISNSFIVSVSHYSTNKDGKYDYYGNVLIKTTAPRWPNIYPNKTILLKDDTIFDATTEDYILPDIDDDGLSAGAIAGIVITVVVVVAVVVFCIVWFVVLKKGCCGKSQKGESSEA